MITKQPDNSAKQTPAVTETPDNTEPNEPQRHRRVALSHLYNLARILAARMQKMLRN